MLREKFKSYMTAVLIIMAVVVAIALGIKDSGLTEDHYTITVGTETIYDGPGK